ncbi:hypothetical protein S58_71790 [Bradyrhizobium oligotrophicum S58]|uniref:Uncharacterized protein n=1 Tax=Bradyrhizobium oligotrophicum S58 TaxID=1245469 RepID=M4ZH60_9BRAD|nr:Mov34/MPN/PAD-1 family protein [Bradyrhizobium oligotrophicum]BAM93143.1 hypothetical protein S58_71790 [Bradyrhizobium oligotrophicum S58]
MSSILCSSDVLKKTIALLRREMKEGQERVALWLTSSVVRSPATIVEVYEPEQVVDVDYFRIPPASMRTLMDHLRSTRRRIAAQIHTHPGRAYHSEVDAEWAIVRHVGALSLVLPRFAASTTPKNFLEEVMTYEYSHDGEWEHRPNFGADARVKVTS